MTTFAGKTIPPLFTPVGFGPSFFNSPFVMYDQLIDYQINAGQNFEATLKWETFGVGASNLLTRTDFTTVETGIATVPLQWHINAPGTFPGGSALAALRWVGEEGPSAWSQTFATVGTWVQMNTSRQMRVAPGASPSVQENTGVFEMAFQADVSVVEARARITLRVTRG